MVRGVYVWSEVMLVLVYAGCLAGYRLGPPLVDFTLDPGEMSEK
jgi:hypothetical protein